jgi:excisionase family DNA binding protein
MQKTVSVREAAKMLGCSRKWLFDLLYEDRLPGARKAGRQWQIPVSVIQERLREREARNG